MSANPDVDPVEAPPSVEARMAAAFARHEALLEEANAALRDLSALQARLDGEQPVEAPGIETPEPGPEAVEAAPGPEAIEAAPGSEAVEAAAEPEDPEASAEAESSPFEVAEPDSGASPSAEVSDTLEQEAPVRANSIAEAPADGAEGVPLAVRMKLALRAPGEEAA